MDTLSNTALLSGEDQGGGTKEGGQPITQASTNRSDTSGTVGSPPLISLISAKPIRQTPRVKCLFSVTVRV